MGNSVSPCLQNHHHRRRRSSSSSSASVELIFSDGITRILAGNHIAGEIMFQFPDMMICHADSFFIGHPLPSLSIHDHLIPGHTYFVLPLDRFPSSDDVLSTSSLAAAAASAGNAVAAKFANQCPFEYIRGANGRVLIKVVPEFIARFIISPAAVQEAEIPSRGGVGDGNLLCSTPELQKHYDQLVGSKGQVWSPKLETISEYKIRYSPCRFVGFKVLQKEG